MHDDLLLRVRALGFDLLDITAVHATTAAHLPHHHRDPFDRMVIAQAIAENRILITCDQFFSVYGIGLLPC